eukprot:Platyproteum_vivax@DN1438_c0_g1_i1.p1
MSPPQSVNPKDLASGAALQMAEAATLGMPFEVWKTRMGRFQNESTVSSFRNVYKRGGPLAFWQGLGPKMVECASKGSVLLFSKEAILNSCTASGLSSTLSGFIAGAGGGICQTAVMGPCTYIVTSMVTGAEKKQSAMAVMKSIWKEKGIRGFYAGSSAIALRQASNWASRQGLTEYVRYRMLVFLHNDPKAKLTVPQEAMCGIAGGALSCWNHPFEVARIQMQAAANEGKKVRSLTGVWKRILAEKGVRGLYQGLIPRLCLGIWQTLFMVTGAKVVKQYL